MNCYQDGDDLEEPAPYRPDSSAIEAQIEAFKRFKKERDESRAAAAIEALSRAANSESENIFVRVVEAAEAGATQGEITARLREDLGFGQPLVVE